MRAVTTYANQPRELHWRTAIGILAHVFSTSDFGITFQKGSGLELVAFADADYAIIAKPLTGQFQVVL